MVIDRLIHSISSSEADQAATLESGLKFGGLLRVIWCVEGAGGGFWTFCFVLSIVVDDSAGAGAAGLAAGLPSFGLSAGMISWLSAK